MFSAFFIKITMNTYHAVLWSDPYSSSDEEDDIRYMGVYQQQNSLAACIPVNKNWNVSRPLIGQLTLLRNQQHYSSSLQG